MILLMFQFIMVFRSSPLDDGRVNDTVVRNEGQPLCFPSNNGEKNALCERSAALSHCSSPDVAGVWPTKDI
jgi:hypothetical protein